MTLTDKEIQEILAILGEIPSKYVFNLISFFNQKLIEQKNNENN